MTLGGDDTPSQTIPDPHTAPGASGLPLLPSETERVQRTLHLWEDGFSVEDGPLYRFDDPANAETLALIRNGRAPIHMMNVQPNQSVEVTLKQHTEKYKKPEAVYRPFGGSGRVLGNPLRDEVEGRPVSGPAAAIVPAAATASSGPSAPVVAIDESEPTIALRIQLASGIRLPVRFNATHTIGDIYDFISRASPDSSSRPWVLATTFPNKDHSDKEAKLGDVAEFKRGGTAVQKWT